MTTKISLEKFAEKLSDHRPEDLIEMLYGMMSDDDLIEMAAEEEDEEEERECVGCGERKSNGIEEDDEWICEDCDGPECDCCGDKTLNQGCGKMVNRGCCSNGACDHGVDVLCGECGTWDEEDEVWRCPDCQEEHEGKSANSSTYGGGCRRICRFCKEECSCWNYNSDHEVVCEDCGDWCEEHEQVMYKNGMKCGGCMDDEDEKRLQERTHHIMVFNDPLPCETCKKPAWSNNDAFKKVHGCIVCQDCFDENEKDHEEQEKKRLPSVKVDLEMLLEHVKKLQKEDPKEYERLNLIFQKCGAI